MTAHALLFSLSAIGVAESVYLVRARLASQRPVCPIGGNCALVLGSKYNKLFRVIHNDVAGLSLYLALLVLTALLLAKVGPADIWNTLVVGFVTAGSAMSLILIFIQARLLKAWCFWCLVSALIVFSMLIILLAGRLN